jgi:hypothetical protein
MVYKVRDLMVNVIRAGGGGSTSLPADDSTPVPTPITPIAIDASLVALTPIVNTAIPAVKDVLKTAVATNGHAEALARSGAGLADGSASMNAITREVAATLVGAVVLQGRGSAGMPDPNCGGTSMETIPTPLTPYVHKAKDVLRVEDLAVLKRRLTRVLEAVEVAEKALAPKGREAVDLAERLKGAASELSKSAATSA